MRSAYHEDVAAVARDSYRSGCDPVAFCYERTDDERDGPCPPSLMSAPAYGDRAQYSGFFHISQSHSGQCEDEVVVGRRTVVAVLDDRLSEPVKTLDMSARMG